MRTDPEHPIRAIFLMSGGLDSILSVRLLQRQGIEILALAFKSIFFDCKAAERAAALLKVPIRTEDFTDSLISFIANPRHGLGSGMNPCIDCRIGMLRRAGQIMKQEGFHFLGTGEVLNQRPMSQNRKALELTARESGCAEYIVRPLSARLMPPTLPESRGWVDREQLPGLRGRGRKQQMRMAEDFGITEYPQPAGGCILTDPRYAVRLRDLGVHEGLEDIKEIGLLRVGRHFRIGGIKLVVGRNKQENQDLERACSPDKILVKCEKFPGPSALIGIKAHERELETGASICAGYADCPAGIHAELTVQTGAEKRAVRVMPAEKAVIESFMI